jgi:hypothetical protein
MHFAAGLLGGIAVGYFLSAIIHADIAKFRAVVAEHYAATDARVSAFEKSVKAKLGVKE